MNHIEQEHLDHVAGSATEHQNSHAMSVIGLAHRNSEVRAEITKLIEAGQFVVVSESTACCPVTDGITGVHIGIYSRHNTLPEAMRRMEEDAEECHNAEINLHIEPSQQAIAEEAESHGIDMDDDCPF
jgi:hypothetical protein